MHRQCAEICWKISTCALLFLLSSMPLAWAGSAPAAKTAPTTQAASATKTAPAATGASTPSVGAAGDGEVRVQCDDDPDCGEAVQRALSQSDSKDYEAALKTYQAVCQRWPTPWLLINLGRVQQKIGRPAEAVVTYQRYLDTATHDKPERIKVARAFLAQAQQEIEVQGYKKQLSEAKAKERPIYKKWWFWVAIGGTVAAAAAITAGIVVGTRSGPPVERQPAMYHVEIPF